MSFLSRIGSRMALKTTVRQLNMTAPVCSLPVKALSRDELMGQWTEYFDSDLCDYFYFRKGAYRVFNDDFVADPAVYQSMLYCCRRLNNFPAAMRTLELMRFKCGDREEVYDWLMQELAPTMEDLGLPSVEDMNLHIVATEF